MAGCLGGGLGTPPGPVSSCPDVGIDGTHCSAKMPDFVRDLDGMPTRRCANHLDGRRAVKTSLFRKSILAEYGRGVHHGSVRTEAGAADGVGAGGVFGPDRRALTIGLVLAITLVGFEALAISTVLPDIKDDLHGVSLYGWVFSAFFLGTIVGIVVAGYSSDRHGPARPFAAGLVLFGLGLLAGGFAPSMGGLVAARAVQGLGAGAIPAVAYVAIGRA